MVERANKTLNYRLRLLTPRNNLRTWDAYVQGATFSINNSINRITGNKPFKLMRGYNPRTKLDNYFFTIEENFDVNIERIRAREKIEQAQNRYYAENSQPEAKKTKLKCDDFIIVKESAIQLDYGKKLSRKLTGSYLITKLNDSVVTTLHWKTQRKVKVNLDRVYLYTGRINKRMKLLQKSQ